MSAAFAMNSLKISDPARDPVRNPIASSALAESGTITIFALPSVPSHF